MASKEELIALAERVEAMKGFGNNSIDVLIECALYQPGTVYTAIRANNAGTKVIYTDAAGNDVTCWAEGWTTANRRAATCASLRARAAMETE